MNAIPENCFEQHIAILGKTGSGKTYTAKGAVERILQAGQRVCILDPTGVWWGLRSDCSGKGKGFPVVVFGGEHGDLPISRNNGAAIAEIVGTTNTSAVIDTRMMTVGERTQFATDFSETILRKNTGVLHLVIDEAHVFAPQGKIPDPQAGRMLHAVNNLVSLGRGRGLRITLISQRPAKLHKDSLTQVETLIAMRLIAPQDRNAVKEWMFEWADAKQGAEIMSSLPSLRVGEGWIWAPELNILSRAKFPKITTYDSSRAPNGTADEVALAAIDLPAIEERLKTVAADLAQNDPKRLQARIKELEAEAGNRAIPTSKESLEVARKQGYAKAIEEARRAWAPFVDAARNLEALIPAELEYTAGVLDEGHYDDQQPEWAQTAKQVQTIQRVTEKQFPRDSGPSEKMEGGLRRMLTALANRSLCTAVQVGIRAKISSKSGTFGTYLGRARSMEWIDGTRDALAITPAGIKALGAFEQLPEGAALRAYWLSEVEAGASRMLSALCSAYPKPLTAERLGELAGISHSSGTFGTYLGKLRSLELITGSRSDLRASQELF